MKKQISILLCIILVTSVFVNVFAEEKTENLTSETVFYVSPDGDDNNSGTERAPFKSLEGARNKVRSLLKRNHKDPITVVFKEGEYRFDKTVEMNALDSGREGGEITYKAEEGANVVFKGSVLLDVSKFKMVTDKNILERIPDSSRDFIGQLDLKLFGITSMPEFGGGSGGNEPIKYNDIYLDNKMQINARYPNIGYLKINEIVNSANGVFRPAGTNVTKWGKAKDVQIAGHISNTYAYDRTKVLEINPQERTLKLDTKWTTKGLTNTEYGFFAYNLLEEIDNPGEWFVDKDSMILYYYPPHPLSNETLEISRLRDSMIIMDSVSHITFDGISFSQMCGDAINVKNSNNITVKNCEFNNIGRNAISDRRFASIDATTLNITNGNNNVLIENNVFSEIGGHGVRITGGDLKNLIPSGNKIVNNHFYNFQTYQRYGYAVSVNGVGTVVEHNTIHNAPHGGISFDGNDHIIRYNELYDLCKEANDCGAIYSGRNLNYRGVEIAYNYIHDVDIMDETREHTGKIQEAIYYDDRLSDGHIHHNIIERCSGGIFMHGGQDMYIHDNIIIETNAGIKFSHCGTGYQELYERALNVYNQYPAYKKYDKMKEEELYARKDDFYPKGNVCFDNLFVNSDGQGVEKTEYVYLGEGINENKIYDNVVSPDFDGFEDIENKNYNIKSDSEILKEIPGLAEIDMSEIGMSIDTVEISESFRKTSPKNAAKNVSSSQTLFSWEILPKADRYRLIIATDPELKNRVYDEEVYYNVVTLNTLDSDNTKYYWDVWGYSNSKDSKGEWVKSKGDAYLLTTSKYDDLDKLLLNDEVNKAEAVYSELSVGEETGQSKTEDIKEFREAIDKAISVNNLKYGSQKEVDAACEELKMHVASMNSKRNIGYVSITDMLDDSKKWNASTNSEIKDNVFTIKSGHATYMETVNTFKVLRFKIKVDFNGGWMAFGMRQKSPGVVWSGGTGYLFAFKENEFEYQRFVSGSGGYLQDNISNDYIKDGVWHDIEIASCDVENGVWNFLKVDDSIVLNTIDSNGYIKDAALFQVYCFGTDMEIQLKAADEKTEKFDTSLIYTDKGFEVVEPTTLSGDMFNIQNIVSVSGTVKEIPNGILMENGIFTYKDKLAGNEVFNMNMKFNLDDEKYSGLGIRIADNKAEIGKTNGYVVKIKNDRILFERKSNGGNLVIGSVKNKFIISGQTVNVEFGSYQTKEGIRVVFYVNNSKVFDYTEPYAEPEAGFIAFYDEGFGIEIVK